MDTVLSGTTVYEEHQSFRVLIVIAAVAGAGLILTAAVAGAGFGQMAPQDKLSAAFAVLLVVAALWGFSRLNTIVSTTELRFGFPVWHRRVALGKVTVGEVTKIPLWYGIGLHYVGGLWVYNARLGRGVIVVVDGRRYLIGSETPERLQAALLQVAARRDKV